MKHRTEHPELTRIGMDIARLARPAVIAEEQGAALERAGELFLAGDWFESRNVSEQGRWLAQQRYTNEAPF